MVWELDYGFKNPEIIEMMVFGFSNDKIEILFIQVEAGSSPGAFKLIISISSPYKLLKQRVKNAQHMFAVFFPYRPPLVELLTLVEGKEGADFSNRVDHGRHLCEAGGGRSERVHG